MPPDARTPDPERPRVLTAGEAMHMQARLL